MLTPHEALSRIPGWDARDVAWRELPGGLTNRTYRLKRRGRSYVLRLDSEHTAAFDLDRARELAVLENAAARELAPAVEFADTGAGILLSDFVDADPWQASDLQDEARLEALAGLLRRVHALPSCGAGFDASGIAERYLRNLSSQPALHAFGRRCVEIVATQASSGERRCCHNDVVAENIIGFPAPVLIDWEYACDNDPLFDLASLIAYHDLGAAETRLLLSTYSGGSDPAMAERLQAQIRIYDALQWLWFANRHAITPAAGHRARLETLRGRIA